MNLRFLYIVLPLLIFSASTIFAQSKKDIPKVHHNIKVDKEGYYVETDSMIYRESLRTPSYTLEQLRGNPQGFEKGLKFDFGLPQLEGMLYYGFIHYEDSKYPSPVYFRKSAAIVGGKADIDITSMGGVYDMIGWQKSGKGTLGYRIITSGGKMLYDGVVSFKGTGPFKVAHTIVDGPYVSLINDSGVTISFETNYPAQCSITIDGKMQPSRDGRPGTKMEFKIEGLQADTKYNYTVYYGDSSSQHYTFRTAPKPGSRQAFSFSYASDSRAGVGGGERNIYGANAYIMRKIMALNSREDARFMQFSGDMISGYNINVEVQRLEYANWKRSIEPFAHHMPVIPAMGNHEALMRVFRNEKSSAVYYFDKFPYATQSAEAIFAEAFVNPTNGPESEDGGPNDPRKKKQDFPSYKENVFYYTYDNVAVVVMNSNYWFAPRGSSHAGGNRHAYIMDVQLKWVRETLKKFERDVNIDHIFITEHTPFFPNGGHVGDDMWYNGSNDPRPTVAGKKAEKGILERRDELLDILVNQNTKVRAILTGDEHNYCRTKIAPTANIYPKDYEPAKIKLNRTIWQINNGAAGAPYYSQQQTPWTDHVEGFTTQNALVFFRVEGKKIKVEVLNPDTLELVDEFDLVD